MAELPTPHDVERLLAAFSLKGITARADRRAYSERVLGRTIGSSRELTGRDVTQLVYALEFEHCVESDAPNVIVTGWRMVLGDEPLPDTVRDRAAEVLLAGGADGIAWTFVAWDT